MNRIKSIFLASVTTLAGAFLIPAILVAEDGDMANAGNQQVSQERVPPAALSVNYVLRPADSVRLSVFKEPDMLTEDRVSRDGTIALPLLGRVKVGGLTIDEARQHITDLYNKDYLVNPQVSLMVTEYAERRVHVHGQVGRPGPVIIPPEEDLTLSAAISASGGHTLRANISSINIRRQTNEDKDIIINVNLREILRNPQAMDVKLQDGDVITVPESIF